MSRCNFLLVGTRSEDIFAEVSSLKDDVQVTYLSLDEHCEMNVSNNFNENKIDYSDFINRCVNDIPKNVRFDIAYLDFRFHPDKVHILLGPVFHQLQAGTMLMGNSYKDCCDANGKNFLIEMANRYDLELSLDENDCEWSLVKRNINISFIIPAFNCARTIEHTINSIVETNFEDGDEIVVVNDGSTDSTAMIIEKFQAKHRSIRYIEHLKNKGGASARNTAVDNALNPLIFCLDSDNILEANSIGPLKKYLIYENADIASFQKLYFFKTEASEITHEWIFKQGLITFADCLSSEIVPISSGNYLFSKHSWELAGGYPLFSRALDAWGFGIRQLGTGQKMVVLKDTGYFHRYGHSSYWVREQSNGDTSRLAFQLLSPFIGKLQDDSIRYLIDAKSRDCWFENLSVKPLKLTSGPRGIGGVAIDNHGNRIGPSQRGLKGNENIFIKIKSLLRLKR